MTKRVRIIAGPNGSGKTTLYQELSKQINFYDFINADEIKVSLDNTGKFSLPFELKQEELTRTALASSFDDSIKRFFNDGSIRCLGNIVQFSKEAVNSYSVAAFADVLRNAYLQRKLSFSMETVFSHRSKLSFLQHAHELGYRVYLYFVATDSSELNVARVEQRVAVGGHNVPREKIISRYSRCLDNLYESLFLAHRAYFWDNSTPKMNFFAELKPNRQMLVVGTVPQWFKDYILKKIPKH